MPASRHLESGLVEPALERGKGVEQLLSAASGTVSWLAISPTRDAYVVRIHRVVDVRTPEFLDVAEFPPVDEAEYVGEGRVVGSFEDAAAALDAAAGLGAAPDRWVNQGLLDSAYTAARGYALHQEPRAT